MVLIYNDKLGLFAHKDSQGQHDKLTTTDPHEAKSFPDASDAWEYLQNFDDDWYAED